MSALDVLKKYWGYDSFRPMQQEVIELVLAGHDTLALMPTGGGKSITFQVPGILLQGTTVVISPLVSLMKDQTDALRQRRISAVFLHAGMSSAESRVAEERLLNGRNLFLYVSPERLRNHNFMGLLRRLDIRLIVVDEAHCISQWGYDFRPAYLEINALRKIAPDAPVLALTATAPPEVADDICRQLDFRKGFKVLRRSFARDNLSYVVRPTQDKISELVRILQRTQGSAIVYVRSREKSRTIAQALQVAGISAAFYHAGLDFSDKEARQDQWKQGDIRVMVATTAFGMGIDKPDVRLVVHMDFPSSLEEYYQEAGRAGRDGLNSYAVLLRTPNDKATLHRRLTLSFPSKPDVRIIYDRVCDFLNIAVGDGYDVLKDFDFDKFCETFKINGGVVRSALQILQSSGYIEFVEDMNTRSRLIVSVASHEIYDLQGLSADAEAVLEASMRTWSGLFTEYQYISESMLSRKTDLDHQQVYEALRELTRQHVVNYIPANRMPAIYLPTAREESRYLMITKEAYENRRSRMEHRMECMLDYAYMERDCRVGYMLRYFGEKDAEDCCKCDICRGRSPQKRATSLADRLINLLGSRATGYSLPEICAHFGARDKEACRVLSQLLGEGYVIRNEWSGYMLAPTAKEVKS